MELILDFKIPDFSNRELLQPMVVAQHFGVFIIYLLLVGLFLHFFIAPFFKNKWKNDK